MSVPAQVIQLVNGEGPTFTAVGDVYRILATGEQTGGAYALSEARVLPGGGPPPHIHRREDEAFFVLEGEITFTLGDRKVVAKPGAFIQGPRGIPHAFKNESNAPARMLIFVAPPGFDKFLAEMAQPVPSFESPANPVTPEEIQKLLAIAPKYGIEILPTASLSVRLHHGSPQGAKPKAEVEMEMRASITGSGGRKPARG